MKRRSEPASGDSPQPASRTKPEETPTASQAPSDSTPSQIQSQCSQALRRGASVRRSAGPFSRLGEGLEFVYLPLLVDLLALWATVSKAIGALFRPSAPNRGLWARLKQLEYASAAAQQAEWDSRFATALRHLASARRCYRRIVAEPVDPDPVERVLDRRQQAATESFADFLAVTWRLSHAATGDLSELIWRLVAQRGATAQKAQALLGHLETVLLEGRTTYYRISLRNWLTQRRLRQVLPFQGTLKSLAALESTCRLLEELPWPAEDLDRFGVPLASLAGHVGERLEDALRPRIRDALDASGLAPDSPQGKRAAKRLLDALARLIRRRGHLKFADVRDAVNREVLSLRDLTLSELWRGDRLGHFDRAAADTLPGVYQRGEFYVKGLQRLSAPLFGTRIGRRVLRLVALPCLTAWAFLKIAVLVWGLFTPAGQHPTLIDPATVLLLGTALSAIANTHPGLTTARFLWRGGIGLVRFFLVAVPGWIRRWWPIAWLFRQDFVRSLLDRVLVPVALGLVPLSPAVALWLFAVPEGPGVTAWTAVMAIAFAFGTLVRETPGGRRRLDDLTTGWHRLRGRLRHERFLTLIAPIMAFFQGIMRTFAEVLHRIRSRLSPRLDEPTQTAVIKALAAPLWATCETVIQFYAVVLIEPQVNPVKHFPAVTLGHKLMLPFLPALSAGLHAGLAAFLPEVILLPLVAATILLLPGAFGFLFWELKENWVLYGVNRAESVPPTRLGIHGETLNGMLRRGFHSGAIPKAFDRLRAVLDRQIREETPAPRQLRRVLAQLAEIDSVIAHFAAQELGEPLRDACPGGRVTMAEPRVASQGIELRARFRPADWSESVELTLELSMRGVGLTSMARFIGPCGDLSPTCRRHVAAVVNRFARRCAATAEPLAILEERMGEIAAR